MKLKETKIIIFDTNILLQESFTLLETKEAEEYLRILTAVGYKIGLPKIIKKELIKNSISDYNDRFNKLSELIEKISKLHDPSKLYLDKLHSKKIIKLFNKRFFELKNILLLIPHTNLHLKKAFRRIYHNFAPNTSKSTQPKDSLILETLLELALLNDVVFITNDKSFFSQRDPNRGIDPIILLEISKNKLNLNIIYGDNFNNFISKFEKDIPPIPKKEITSELNFLIQKEILKHIKNQNITELKKEEITLNSFHTRNKNILLITFSGNFKIFHEDDSAENRKFNSGLISVTGSINYNFDENKLHSFKINTRNLTWPSHTNRKSIHTSLIDLKTD